MLEFDNLRLELEGYEEKIDLLRDALHIKQVSDQVSELEARSQEPDYWNDVERAQKEQTKMKRLQKRIKSFEDLAASREDLLVLCEFQHGTAVITLAGLTNALKIVGKKIEDISVVVNGAGAAATAITKLLISRGLKDVVLCDRTGAIYQGREKLNSAKEEIAAITNQKMKKGSLKDVIVGADVFIGVSAPGVLTAEMVATMAKDPIVFACANPVPEILPDEAKKAGVAVMATGRSDFPNQVNNVLAFPGIFRGALDVRASDINDEMKIAAANAIAGVVSDEELNPEYILPDAFDPRVGKAVAAAVAEAARKSGVARI